MARLLSALALALALGLVAVGCDRDPPPAPKAASASAPTVAAPPPDTRLPLSGRAAFDLIALSDGALLAWSEQGRVSVLRLDRAGARRRAPRPVAELEKPARVAELALRASEQSVAIAWIEQGGASEVLRGVLGDAAGEAFAPAELLAPASVGQSGARGSLALGGDRDRLLAFHRVGREPCQGEPSRECIRVGFTELAGSTPRPRRIPLSIPAACSSTIAGFVVSNERWDYAVCSTASGRPLITVFRIQYDPRYAEAHDVLAGCTPAGAIALAGDVLVAGDCPSGRRAVRVTRMGQTPVELDSSELTLECELGHPVLRAPRAPGFSLRLDAPRDGLAALLPPSIAAAGTRAAWTGARLIVARHVAGSLTLSRWGCRGPAFERVTGPL